MNALRAHRGALDVVAARNVERQRSLGRKFATEERVIASLCQFLAHTPAAGDLDQALFEAWCSSFAALSANVRRNRQRIVRNLCLYRRRTAPSCFVPDLSRFPRPCPHEAPRIFDPLAVPKMLTAASELQATPGSPLRSAVLRLAVVLLYTAGLRRGELLRLSLQDVDSSAGVLRIRQSKFDKSRLVPLSGDARRELRAYLAQRLAPGFDCSPRSPLLCNRARGLRGYTGTGLSGGIHALFVAADVRDRHGRRPRIHDFRHVFALQALRRWYRAGLDVQSNLPKLALYMGHVSIVSTAYYLKWIPEIAEAASARFERQCGYLLQGGAV